MAVISSPCPIEMEPKTLKPGQIDHVRELAVRITQKMEPHEATDVFTQGLEEEGALGGHGLEQIEEDSEVEGIDCSNSKGDTSDTSSPHCLCRDLVVQVPAPRQEPLTAPF